MKQRVISLAVCAIIAAFPPSNALHAQITAFTYQGRLVDSGSPANGIYDLRFTVCDALTNGNVVAGPSTNSAIGVSNGLFTVTLDFGSGVFTGPNRWLDIGVRAGTNHFTALSPRQPFLAVPYSFYAANAGTAVMANSASSVPAANIVGTLTNNTTGNAATASYATRAGAAYQGNSPDTPSNTPILFAAGFNLVVADIFFTNSTATNLIQAHASTFSWPNKVYAAATGAMTNGAGDGLFQGRDLKLYITNASFSGTNDGQFFAKSVGTGSFNTGGIAPNWTNSAGARLTGVNPGQDDWTNYQFALTSRTISNSGNIYIGQPTPALPGITYGPGDLTVNLTNGATQAAVLLLDTNNTSDSLFLAGGYMGLTTGYGAGGGNAPYLFRVGSGGDVELNGSLGLLGDNAAPGYLAFLGMPPVVNSYMFVIVPDVPPAETVVSKYSITNVDYMAYRLFGYSSNDIPTNVLSTKITDNGANTNAWLNYAGDWWAHSYTMHSNRLTWAQQTTTPELPFDYKMTWNSNAVEFIYFDGNLAPVEVAKISTSGFTGNGGGLTNIKAESLTGLLSTANLPGITTNVSIGRVNPVTFHITNGLIMRVSGP